MVKSVLAFEEVGQVGLAKDSGSRSGPEKAVSFARAPNAMIQVYFLAILTIETRWRSPLYTLNTWVSTYGPPVFSKACVAEPSNLMPSQEYLSSIRH